MAGTMARYNDPNRVVWDAFNNMTAVGGVGKVTKTSGAADWDTQAFAHGQTALDVACTIAFRGVGTAPSVICGLTDHDNGGDYTTIRYGLYVHADTRLWVFENGGAPFASATGFYDVDTDTFSVVSDGTTVDYRKNGVSFYTSALSAAGLTIYPAIAALNTGNGVSQALFTKP